ncbi:glutamate receptor -like [Olea europaea subsp. europaea]|uniref:Glutamate receptor n=2 Tax=Olea europaea subsp. europaea TaxID=158383 RepID=A0A8S0RR25_OLEEU|nr:glutamate receptor -like [Olea europaea subsp. europaea]
MVELQQSQAELEDEASIMDEAEICARVLEHPNYRTRLHLHTKDAKGLLNTNIAALELLKNGEVQGILGPQGPTEDKFVAELGGKFHIPVISFTTSSTLPSEQNRYFVSMTPNDSYQAQALAAICEGYEWPEVVILYEDTDYGYQFLSHLNKAFHDVEIGMPYMSSISISSEDNQILKEFNKLKEKQTRVFLVHMNASLGHRLFVLAKKEGMMTEGYVWIITDYLSNFLNSMDFVARDSMEGVLGIRPYVSRSEKLDRFHERWQRNMVTKKSAGSIRDFNVYGLWVYDTVCSLAIAAEKIGPVNSSLLYVSTSKNGIDNTNLKISAFGPKLLTELSNTKFRGLSGDFQLINGQLKPPAFEIFNVIGTGEKTVGFWRPDRGISRELSPTGERTYSTSTKNLKNVLWPGDSVTQPKGWAILAAGKLRVGVPVKNGFREFVNVTIDPATNRTIATGFSIDIFMATLPWLPSPINYEFYHYNNDANLSYDGMLHCIPQMFDMVVGDTTIWAPRAKYVDFSLPYSEPGVILVVKNMKPFDMWIFIKPLRWDLWLAIILASILMGIVLRLLERRVRNTNKESIQPRQERLRMIYWSPIVVLAFPERNMVANSWSIFVLVFWLFMAFILMQSYTANLSAILTVDQLKFAFSEDYYVGYQDGSFMKEFLKEHLHIDESRLKSYSSVEEYHDAMSRGSKRGGIDAIFDEIPYMKILLKKYDSQYKMVGPMYRTNGFGFAFPVDSPLTSYFSRAILAVSEGSNMTSIEQTNFGPGDSSEDPLSSTVSPQNSSLTFYNFGGLFIIVGSVTLFALFCSETSVGRKFTALSALYSQMCFSFIYSKFCSRHDDGEESHESIQNVAGHTSSEGRDVSIVEEPPNRGEEEICESDQQNESDFAEVELTSINEEMKS